MPNTTLKTKIKHRIDNSENWITNSNVILENGEIGFERTNSGDVKFKVGDGIKTWDQLSYIITDNTLNNQSLKFLKEKYNINDIEYETETNIFPNQTISIYQSSLAETEAIKIIAFIENQTISYYLNSSNILLEKFIFEDPTIIGLNQDDECYTLYYNFDLTTFGPTDDTKPYYILNIIYKSEQNFYMIQCITSLTPQNAPTQWIIYELLTSEVIIENTMTQNSDNLLTNKAIYNILSSFSMDYNDLQNKPSLATVATSGSYNDLSNKPVLFSGSYDDLTDQPELATIATSGNYYDLSNRPTLFSGNYNDLSNRPTLFSGSYDDLTNKPSLALIATSGDYNDLSNKPTLFSGTYDDLTNKPLFATIATTGDYNDLINKPTSFSGSYNDLTNKPTLFSGNYNDLTNKPNIPTDTGDLTNTAGFITSAALNNYALNSDLNTKQNILTFDNTPTENSNNPVKSSGIYNAINNVVQIANGKTACYVFDTVSEMNAWLEINSNRTNLRTGDVFLIRALDVPDYWWDETANNNNGSIQVLETTKVDLTNYVQKDGNKVLSDNNYTTLEQTKLSNLPAITTIGNGLSLNSGTLSTSFSGSYNDLTNKPSLFSGNYNDLANKPNIPTDTNDLTNAAGFITSAALTNIPSRVSYTSSNLAAWNSNGNLVDSGYQIVVSNIAPTVNNQNVITFVI